MTQLATRPKPKTSHEPEFITQTAEPMTPAERHEWFREQARAADMQGATYHRFSVDDAAAPKVTLYEGWKVRPDDQGRLRFKPVA